MTASEMIKVLQTVPPDTILVYRDMSDWNEVGEVKFVTADESKRMVDAMDINHPGKHPSTVEGAFVERKGRVCTAYRNYLYGKPQGDANWGIEPNEVPNYIDVISIEG